MVLCSVTCATEPRGVRETWSALSRSWCWGWSSDTPGWCGGGSLPREGAGRRWAGEPLPAQTALGLRAATPGKCLHLCFIPCPSAPGGSCPSQAVRETFQGDCILWAEPHPRRGSLAEGAPQCGRAEPPQGRGASQETRGAANVPRRESCCTPTAGSLRRYPLLMWPPGAPAPSPRSADAKNHPQLITGSAPAAPGKGPAGVTERWDGIPRQQGDVTLRATARDLLVHK